MQRINLYRIIRSLARFLSMVYSKGIEAGTVIEITVTRPGEEPVTSNIRVQESDLELIQSLQNLAN